MPLSLYLLALAVFAMGTSEFMLSGLLPDLAADLGIGIGTAGLLTSAFAVGMVVGAPLMAGLARGLPRRASLVTFLVLFLLAHIAGAMTETFALLLITRVLAALTNAGFLAVALSTATDLVPEDRKGRALSILLAGITIATIAGVPGGALIGTMLGWRATFWAIAILCLPAIFGVLRGSVPKPTAERVDLRHELAQLGQPRLALVLILTALINAATFGSFTFLGAMVIKPAGLDPIWVVPLALMLFGLGSFAGVTVAGRFADRRPGRVLAIGGPALFVGWVLLAIGAGHPLIFLPLVGVQGALSFAVGSTLITRVLYEASAAPTMAGSYATAALNVGATVGPILAATTLGTALAERGPAVASGFLIAIALLVIIPTRRLIRKVKPTNASSELRIRP